MNKQERTDKKNLFFMEKPPSFFGFSEVHFFGMILVYHVLDGGTINIYVMQMSDFAKKYHYGRIQENTHSAIQNVFLEKIKE